MAIKFPSQNKLNYAQAAAVSNDGWTAFTTRNAADDGTISTGQLNIPKDLSILNMRGYHSADKGVPLVYDCVFTLYAQDEDGFGYDLTPGIDFATTLKIDGCLNNWVMRNAAVKFHAAREKMFRDAGITKKMRGAYSSEIRYDWDAAGDTWLQPVDGNGDPFAGGTWDTSRLSLVDDNDFSLRLVGDGVTEDSAVSPSSVHIGYSYLSSRQNIPDDTNLESDTLAKYSILRNMLAPQDRSGNVSDDISDEAADAQDNPPYDVFAISDTGHDITEAVELGRAVAGLGNQIASVRVQIPFGICSLRLTHYDQADTNVTSEPFIQVEVMDIYPMQG